MASQPNPVIALQRAISDMDKILKELNERIRLVEEKVESLELKASEMQQKDHEIIEEINSFKRKTLIELDDLSKRTSNLEINLTNLEKDLRNYAKKVELKELKNYIDLIKPVTTQFVTRSEVKEMINKRG